MGICYGMQLLACALGGAVDPAARREYGPAEIALTDAPNPLFAGLQGAGIRDQGSGIRDQEAEASNQHPASGPQSPVPSPQSFPVWMSHGDHVTELPPSFAPLAVSNPQSPIPNSPTIAAMGDVAAGIYGVQFHPEVQHTPQGRDILRNFAVDVCGCRADWTPAHFIAETIEAIRAQVGEGRVICGLSGGVDSAVAASLIHRAIGDRLTASSSITVCSARARPTQVVRDLPAPLGMRLIAVNAAGEFTADLAGTVDPEEKRKRIGARFVRTFEAAEAEAARAVEGDHAAYLAQGTLYPDVIESASRHEQATAAHDQDASQRRRSAGGYELPAHRAAAQPVQG